MVIIRPIWTEIDPLALIDLDLIFGRHVCDERLHIPFLLRYTTGVIYPYILSPGDVYRP